MAIANASHNGMLRRRRVMIVDDPPLVRRGVAQLIACETDLEPCGESADAQDALEQIKARCPDVVLVDLSLRNGHSITLIELHREKIKMKLSLLNSAELNRRAVQWVLERQ